MTGERLRGKVVLITGGSRGQGASHARAVVAEGARVVIADVLDGEGKALADELGDACLYSHLDVRNAEEWQSVARAAVAHFGGLDVLVNNAGVLLRRRLDETSDEDWDRVISINMGGAFKGIRATAPHLAASGSASIINVSSIGGLVGFGGMAAYSASKFGLRGLTRVASLELAPLNIRVNSIHPGAIQTTMSSDLENFSHIPIGRAGLPRDVSSLIVYLASDESAFCTGAEFVIDGGETSGKE